MSNAKKSLPNWLTVALLSLWVIVTVLGLWWFQQAKIKPFIGNESDSRFFQPDEISLLLQPYLSHDDLLDNEPLPGQQTLLHFWRPDCLCNNISQRHFSSLLHTFTKQQLRIIIIAHPSSSDDDIAELQRLNEHRLSVIKAKPEMTILPSSPSLAIFNEKQSLQYFGAYGFGAFCTVRDDNFLSSLIEKNIAGDHANQTVFTNVIGDGCFCRW